MTEATVGKIIDRILELSYLTPDLKCPSNKGKMVANEAAIYWKTFWIAENKGIDEAMAYFTGAHNEEEYKEFNEGADDE